MSGATSHPGTAAAATAGGAPSFSPASYARIAGAGCLSKSGMLWLAGWLFTIGFLHLPFWKGVLAIVVWPYYLGSTFAP